MAGIPSNLKRRQEEYVKEHGEDQDSNLDSSAVDHATVESAGVKPGTPAATDPAISEPTSNEVQVNSVDTQVDPAPRESSAEDVESLKHKFRVLQGKYDAEVSSILPKMKVIDQNNEFLREKIEELTRQNADLQDSIREGRASPDVDLTEDERDAYADTIPVIEKLSRGVMTPLERRVAKLEEENQALTERLGQTAESTAATARRIEVSRDQEFFASVKNSVQDFDKINRSTDFTAFLDNPVRGTGATVKEHLMAAHKKRDLEGVKHWFDEFKRSSANPARGGAKALPVVPGKTTGDVAPITKGQLKFSDLTKLHQDAKAKRIPWDDYFKVKEQYELAEREGRLLMG